MALWQDGPEVDEELQEDAERWRALRAYAVEHAARDPDTNQLRASVYVQASLFPDQDHALLPSLLDSHVDSIRQQR